MKNESYLGSVAPCGGQGGFMFSGAMGVRVSTLCLPMRRKRGSVWFGGGVSVGSLSV